MNGYYIVLELLQTSRETNLPSINMSLPEAELYRLTATEVIARLKSEDFKVETYVRSLLSRIEKREPIVKAWAYYDPSNIIDQARRLDNTPREERGPLYGIPIGIKDVIYTQGLHPVVMRISSS